MEAHGVQVDDLGAALARPFGTRVPVTLDVEWYATGRPIEEGAGYQQAGEVDAQVELTEGVLSVVGHGGRLHVWGAVPTAREVLTRAGFLPPTVAGR